MSRFEKFGRSIHENKDVSALPEKLKVAYFRRASLLREFRKNSQSNNIKERNYWVRAYRDLMAYPIEHPYFNY